MNAGDGVFAVGNPLGLERSVSQGIVSTRSRNIEGQLYLQTDAAINPGNSGGPLFNLRGEVIGVTSLKARADMADNLGFAIPVSYVKDFLRNREAFSFDKTNPNTGYRYLDPPRRLRAGPPEGLIPARRGARAESAGSAGAGSRSTRPIREQPRARRRRCRRSIEFRPWNGLSRSNRSGKDKLAGHRRRRARLGAW